MGWKNLGVNGDKCNNSGNNNTAPQNPLIIIVQINILNFVKGKHDLITAAIEIIPKIRYITVTVSS